MNDILRRSLAPITERAWEEIDRQALRVLKTHLSARSIVDVGEPLGWAAGAVNVGRVEIDSTDAVDGVTWGRRNVRPLIELRAPFILNQLEIDNISRGAKDAELQPVVDAARKIATFEERAIYHGFSNADVEGVVQASPHDSIQVTEEAEQITLAAAQAVKRLQEAGIGGPYALVLPAGPYHALMQSTRTGFPLARVVHDVIEGATYWSPGVESGVILSLRGGDYELTLGQDLAIGYASHDRENVELYITESFYFRVLESAAAVPLPVYDEQTSFRRQRDPGLAAPV